MKKTKVVIFTHIDKFLTDTVEYMRRQPDIELRYHRIRNNVPGGYDDAAVYADLRWCDVAFHDWSCVTQEVSDKIRPVCREVVRFHRYEIFREHLMDFDFDRKELIFLSDAQKVLFESLRTTTAKKTVLTDNYVDTDKFSMGGGSDGDNLRILLPGPITERKNQYLALQLLVGVPNITLVMINNGEKGEYYADCDYFARRNKIDYEIHQTPTDDELIKIMQGCDVVLSMSRNEGAHLSVAEAMSCGCIPMVNCWYGADEHYPNVFGGAKEFKRMINNAWAAKANFEYREKSRSWVVNNRDNKIMIPKFVETLLADGVRRTW